MKNYLFTIVIFLVLIVILVIIIYPNDNIKEPNTQNTDSSKHSYVSSSTDITPIHIFRLSRDSFVDFLMHPNLFNLSQKAKKDTLLNDSLEWYITCNTIRFSFDDEICAFLNDKERIESYINNSFEDSTRNSVTSISVIDAPNTPLTIFIEATNIVWFITIDETIGDKCHAYRVYSSQEYINKYSLKAGHLNINGKSIDANISPKIYCNYADVPLVEILMNIGADIQTLNQGEYVIKINNKVFFLNTEQRTLYEQNNKNTNILHLVSGGCVFVYPIKNDIMVDTATLRTVLSSMGSSILINVDWENREVNLTNKS